MGNKIKFKLLREQQLLLHSINFPFFDRIISISGTEDLAPEDLELISNQRTVVCATLCAAKGRFSTLSEFNGDKSGTNRLNTLDPAFTDPQYNDYNGQKRKKTRRKFSTVDNPELNDIYGPGKLSNSNKRIRRDDMDVDIDYENQNPNPDIPLEILQK